MKVSTAFIAVLLGGTDEVRHTSQDVILSHDTLRYGIGNLFQKTESNSRNKLLQTQNCISIISNHPAIESTTIPYQSGLYGIKITAKAIIDRKEYPHKIL